MLGATAPAFTALAALSVSKGIYLDQVKALCAARLSFLRGLSTFGRYGKGWTARVADVEATGVKMVLTAANLHPDVVKRKLEDESKAAQTKSSNSGKAAGGTVAAEVGKDGGTATQVDVTQFDWSHWIGFGLLTIALIGLAIFLLIKWHQHKERAAAYAAAAKEI